MRIAAGKRPAFRDNYLAAVAALIFVLYSFDATAQRISYPNPGTYGIGYHRLVPDSTLYLPTGCGVPTDSTFLFSFGFTGYGQKVAQGAFYYDSCGHHAYIWDPSLRLWHISDSAAGGGNLTDSLTSTFIPYWDATNQFKNSPLSTSAGVLGIRGNTVVYFGGVGPHSSVYASFADTAGTSIYNIGEETAIFGAGTPQDFDFFQGVTTGKTHFHQGGTDNFTISNGSIRPFVGTAATRTGSPVRGDSYYDTDTLCIVSYDGLAWRSVCNGAFNDSRYLQRLNNLSDLTNANTARTNLGLGTAAVRDAPASGNATSSQVVLGNDSRLSTTFPQSLQNGRTMSADDSIELNNHSMAIRESTAGDTTRVSFFEGSAAGGERVPITTRQKKTGGYFSIWEPFNYGRTYSSPYRPYSSIIRPGRVMMGYAADSSQDPGGMPDNVYQFFGYNMNRDFTREDTSDGGVSLRLETHFIGSVNGVGADFELHLPEMVTFSGQPCRLQSFYFNKINGYDLKQEFVDDYQVFAHGTTTPYWEMQASNGSQLGATIEVNGASGANSPALSLRINDGLGDRTELRSFGAGDFGVISNNAAHNSPSFGMENPTGDMYFNQNTGSGNSSGVTVVGNVGFGLFDPTAQLQVISTNRGFKIPMMTTAQMNAISDPNTGFPGDGLLVWNTDSNAICAYHTAWRQLAYTGGPGGSNYQTVQSNASSLTARPKLNFGPMFTLADNSGNSSTDVNSLNTVITDGSAPGITAGGAIPLGGGASYSFGSGSNAVKGRINLTTGTGSGSGNQVFTITLPTQPSANYQVFLQDTYFGTHVNLITQVTSATTFTVNIQDGGALLPSTSYTWSYFIVN